MNGPKRSCGGTAEADFYGHQTKHGPFVFGGSSGLERYNKDNGTPVNSSKTAPCICRGIMKYFPDLANAKIVRTWAGWMDASSHPLEQWMKSQDCMWLVLLTAMVLVLRRQWENSLQSLLSPEKQMWISRPYIMTGIRQRFNCFVILKK